MYVIFLQCTHCVEKTLIVSCTLLCEPGDRVKVDQSSFSAYLHAVMLRHVITARRPRTTPGVLDKILTGELKKS